MAYAAEHVLLRIHGGFGVTIGAPVEHWSVGLRIFIGSVALTESQKTAFLAAIETPIKTFHADTFVKSGAYTSVLRATAAFIGLDGKYVGGDSQPTTERLFASPVFGSGAQQLPFSHARVLTLRSDVDRGRGAYGRIYWPCQETIDPNGKFSVTGTTNSAIQGKVLIDAINTAARVVWSPASAVSVFSQLGLGTIGTVTKVGCGRAPDTQRRRDNDVQEEHVYQDLTTTFAARQAIEDRDYQRPHSE